MTKSTKEYVTQSIEEMKQLVEDSKGDPEKCHERADSLLCSVLRKLGCEELVKEFYKVDKWYAQEGQIVSTKQVE